jgi:hypothetical protein
LVIKPSCLPEGGFLQAHRFSQAIGIFRFQSQPLLPACQNVTLAKMKIGLWADAHAI